MHIVELPVGREATRMRVAKLHWKHVMGHDFSSRRAGYAPNVRNCSAYEKGLPGLPPCGLKPSNDSTLPPEHAEPTDPLTFLRGTLYVLVNSVSVVFCLFLAIIFQDLHRASLS